MPRPPRKPSKSPVRGRNTDSRSAPSRGRKSVSENGPSRGRNSAAENGPSRGRKSASENGPSRARNSASENGPSRGRSSSSGYAPARGRKSASDYAPSRGRSSASEKGPSRGRDAGSDSAPSRGRKPAATAGASRGRNASGGLGARTSRSAESGQGRQGRPGAAATRARVPRGLVLPEGDDAEQGQSRRRRGNSVDLRGLRNTKPTRGRSGDRNRREEPAKRAKPLAPPSGKSSASTAGEGVRLQVLISRTGLASRREAERLIAEGGVTLNGAIVTQPGTRAIPGIDIVKLNGKRLPEPRAFSYFLLNKPIACITTMNDPERRPCVGDIARHLGPGIHPVGRLDFNTSGLLLLTNDGELAERLMHPRHHVAKVYEVKVNVCPSERDLERLAKGIRLGDGKTAPCELRVTKRLDKKVWIEVRLHEGRNQQIRRMFEAIGVHVDKLRRIKLGPLRMTGLAPGDWRPLREAELDKLCSAVGLRSGEASSSR